MNFCGKIVLVTGASSGIGAAAAMKFSKLGAKVILNGRNADRLYKIAEQSGCDNLMPSVMKADLSQDNEVVNLIQRISKECGKLDALINCAGILERGTIEDTNLEQYDRVMGLNLRSMFHITALAVPELIKSKGNIVNVSSVNGIRSFPGVLAYNISKAGVDQLTRCIALELAPKGVRVNCVNPGVIITNLHKSGGMDRETYENFLKHSKNTHAMGRVGTVDEVANAITFLASDLASFTTGVSLSIDGGRHIMCPR